MFASWCLVSTYLIWTWVSRLILSSNQSKATLWVLDTCLTVGLRPLMIILLSAFDDHVNYSTEFRYPQRCTPSQPNREDFAFDDQHYSDQNCRAGLEPWFCSGCACLMLCYTTSFFVFDLWWFGEEWNPSRINPKVQEMVFHPCENQPREIISAPVGTVWNWSLFLAHPTYWHERVTSEYAQESSWCWCWVF